MEKDAMKTNPKKAGIASLLSDKWDFKTISCDFKNHYYRSKEHKIVLNLHVSNNSLKYIKQILTVLKGETNPQLMGNLNSSINNW